jgi:hypothetical protein
MYCATFVGSVNYYLYIRVIINTVTTGISYVKILVLTLVFYMYFILVFYMER